MCGSSTLCDLQDSHFPPVNKVIMLIVNRPEVFLKFLLHIYM